MKYSGYESGKCVLVTGVAGFIGSNLVQLLAQDDWFIIGIDSLKGAGDARLKFARLAEWGIPKEEIRYNKLVVNRHIEKSSFIELDLTDTANMTALFEFFDIRAVCHLGGLTDIGESLVDPLRLIDTNLAGFVNVLENARKQSVEHVVYLGCLGDPGVSVLHAVSRSNELMAEAVSRTYGLPTTGLRVGTVYGPWADPDRLPASFFEKGDGPAERDAAAASTEAAPAEGPATDFVYIDDVLDGLERVLKRGPACEMKEFAKAVLPSYRVYDLGSKEAKAAGCNNEALKREYGYSPKTVFSKGFAAYMAWYKEWYSGEKPRIGEERIIVGRYPFPCCMNWKYIWNKHLELNFSLSDNPDRLLKSLIVSDGFDMGLGEIEPEDWTAYVEQMCGTLKLNPDMRVFEVGCGGGAFLYPLYRKGFAVGGIDYASNLVHMAKLAMPDGRFAVYNAKDMVPIGVEPPAPAVPDVPIGQAIVPVPVLLGEKADVVLANSVFQYFDSLKMAEAVLMAMFAMAESTVAVLNVPDLNTEMEEIEASRNALPVNLYDELYDGLKHLYIERNWFVMVGKRAGWKARVFAQQISNYGKNPFRYNVVFKKVTSC